MEAATPYANANGNTMNLGSSGTKKSSLSPYCLTWLI